MKRHIVLLSLLACSPSAALSVTQEYRSEATYHDVSRYVREQADTLASILTCIRNDHSQLSQHDIQTIEQGIRDLYSTKQYNDTSLDTIATAIQTHYLRAQQIYELATDEHITTQDVSQLSRVNFDTTIDTLHTAYEEIQHIIDAAISQMSQPVDQSCLHELQETIINNPIYTAGVTIGGCSALATIMYIMYHSNILQDMIDADLTHGILRRIARAFELTTAWTRYRTPHEISTYAPQALAALLQSYKKLLTTIYFPGNIDKRPIAKATSTALPDAQEFKRHAKSQGYDVEENRIPGDIIDLKFYKINLLDAALITPAVNQFSNDAVALWNIFE